MVTVQDPIRRSYLALSYEKTELAKFDDVINGLDSNFERNLISELSGIKSLFGVTKRDQWKTRVRIECPCLG